MPKHTLTAADNPGGNPTMRKTTQDDRVASNIIGWAIVGVCLMAYPFVGFWGLFSFFVLFGLCFAWIGLKAHEDFIKREERAAANHRRRQAEVRAQLNEGRAEAGRVKAHANRPQAKPVLWGVN